MPSKSSYRYQSMHPPAETPASPASKPGNE
jgi:hypothetical protein